MDPSSNNNPQPQYYPPPQQNPPLQQGYPHANPYPPQQYQQAYPPANAYQYPQQAYPPPQYDQQQQEEPQIPSPIQNNLDQLDRGWFQCYKVALVIAVILGGLEVLGALSFFAAGKSYTILYGLVQSVGGLCLMALVSLQFVAMKNRDLKKAKMALIGFLGYVPLGLFSPFAFYLFTVNFPIQSALAGFVYLFIYDAVILIGSFKVYQLLNTNQIKPEFENYENQNYYAA